MAGTISANLRRSKKAPKARPQMAANRRPFREEHAMAQAFDSRPGYIFMDGRFVAWTDAKLHVLSHGLHYASAVFEGQRAYGGEIFKLEDHTRRLHDSA